MHINHPFRLELITLIKAKAEKQGCAADVVFTAVMNDENKTEFVVGPDDGPKTIDEAKRLRIRKWKISVTLWQAGVNPLTFDLRPPEAPCLADKKKGETRESYRTYVGEAMDRGILELRSAPPLPPEEESKPQQPDLPFQAPPKPEEPEMSPPDLKHDVIGTPMRLYALICASDPRITADVDEAAFKHACEDLVELKAIKPAGAISYDATKRGLKWISQLLRVQIPGHRVEKIQRVVTEEVDIFTNEKNEEI